MATDVIPFANLQQSGLSQVSGASPEAMNVVTDMRGAVRRRPGIEAYSGAIASTIDSNGIAGMHVTDDGELFVVGAPVLGQAPVYYVSDTAVSNLGNVAATAGRRPTFAETEALLVIAFGGTPRKIVLSTRVMTALGGSPPDATHIIGQNLRLLANDASVDRTKVRYSEQAIGSVFTGHEIWTPGANTAGFFTAEARPDPVVALGENTNEVFVFGTSTLQVHAPDPALVYAPVSAIEVGCSAPYSIVKRHEDFAWLDDDRRIVESDGRGFQAISHEIQQELNDLESVSEIYGYRPLLGVLDGYAWRLPDDRTFVRQQGVGWGQWASWDGSDWTPFPVVAHAQIDGEAVPLVGTEGGRVGRLSFGTDSDFEDRVRAYVETGFLDRGTSARKLCKAVRFVLRRGESEQPSGSEPMALFSWRDTLGEWESPIQVSMGHSSDLETTVIFRSVGGPYRARQWRFEFSGAVELVLVRAEEEFEVLGS